MIKFDDYREKYSHVRMERQDGILQITFHTEGAALKWSGPSHEQLGYAFADIARDQDNRVVIMTGTGDAFCAEIDMRADSAASRPRCGTISIKTANIC